MALKDWTHLPVTPPGAAILEGETDWLLTVKLLEASLTRPLATAAAGFLLVSLLTVISESTMVLPALEMKEKKCHQDRYFYQVQCSLSLFVNTNK